MKKIVLSAVTALSLMTVGHAAHAEIEVGNGNNPVFYDGQLYFKDKGVPVYIPGGGVPGPAGPAGLNGKSAYEIALSKGFSGSETDWLNSLKGKDGTNGTNGTNGKSAYDLAVESGFTGTRDEWVASLKGEKGDKGDRGNDGNHGTNGNDGSDGKSAYDLAVEAGFEGTQEEYLASLKGKDGNDGKDGTNGTNGKDGKDGKDSVGFSRKQYMADLATTAALGGIELRQGGAGVTSWSAGVGAVKSAGHTGTAIAIGLHHGISDNMGIYGKLSHSINGKSTAVFVGVEGQF